MVSLDSSPNSSQSIKVGVLGGIGPEATNYFYSNLIKKLQKKGLIKQNQDYPQIIINSIPAPELVKDDVSEEDLEPYIKGLKDLDSLNPNFIVMVCNTIHIFHNRLQSQVKAPILNLKSIVKKEASKYKKPLLISTKLTANSLYNFSNVIIPNESELEILTESISNYNHGKDKEIQKIKVKDICFNYLSSGADIVILGCTEFAVMLSDENFPKINTLDLLINETLKEMEIRKTTTNEEVL